MDGAGFLCELCGRLMKRATTRHHLVPRAVHRKKRFRQQFSRAERLRTVAFCHDCHRAVHDLVPDEGELAREFHTIERLRAHPAIAKFLGWVRKQR